MSEKYVYLGRQIVKNRTIHFFFHSISNEKYFSLGYDLDNQIMNCMINETMIHSSNEICIIFTLLENKLKVLIQFHRDTDSFMTMDEKSLIALLPRLIKIANEELKEDKLSFEYFYDSGYFLTFEKPIDIIKEIPKDTLSKTTDFDYFITTKEIFY
jgi:hypothetical protein